MSPSSEEMVAGLVLFLLGFFVLTLVFSKINQAINNLQNQVDDLGVELARVKKAEEEVIDLVLVEDGILLAPGQPHPTHLLREHVEENIADNRITRFGRVRCVLCGVFEDQDEFHLQCRPRTKG